MMYTQEACSSELKAKIDAGFSQHAIESVGANDKGEIVSFTAYDDSLVNRTIFVGSVCVQLFYGQLHIKYVYIEPSYREAGIGTKLMQMAFKYGRLHQCTFAFVETMSFQAPKFYQKLGFILEFTRPGFVKGISYHYLRCDL